VACLVVSPRLEGDQPKASAGPENKLVGTWKMVSAKYGGEERPRPVDRTTLKHITPAQFLWLSYDQDGKVYRMAGGSYTLKDDSYEETPEYGLGDDFALIRGKLQKFKCKVEGDKWYHNGALSNGLTIEEVWERVEKK
jgi:hypothetical protein